MFRCSAARREVMIFVILAGDYPQDSMYLLQHLFNNWYRDLSLDKMAAAAVVTGAAILILILFLQKAWAREDTL